MRRVRQLMLAAALGAAGVADVAAEGATELWPETFFAGTTRSSGVTTDASGQRTGTIASSSRGRRENGGATVFDQTIRFSDGTLRRRRWRMARTGPSTIEVSGSDLVGVGRGDIRGRIMTLITTVRLDDGNPLSDVDFDQIMELQPDGRRLTMRSTVTRLGYVVGRTDEVFILIGGGRDRRNAR